MLGREPTVSALVTGALVLLVIGVTYTVQQSLARYWEITNDQEAMVNAMSLDVREALQSGDVTGLIDALRVVTVGHHLSMVSVYTADGSLFAHYPEERIVDPVDLRFGTHFEDGNFINNSPIVYGEGAVGVISLNLDWRRYLGHLLDHLLVGGFAIIFSMLLLAYSWWLQKRFAQKERNLMRAKEMAEKANETKSVFLAHMTHELRSPLHTVMGMTELLSNTQLTHKQRNYVENIHHSGEVLLNVVSNNLQAFKLESDKIRLDYDEFEIEDLIESSIELLGYTASFKKVELVCCYQDTIGLSVVGDFHRLQQVIVNLLTNAIKFTEEGEVALHCSRISDRGDRARLRFSVIDSGVGINPDFLMRVFDMMSQAGTTAPPYQGVGLGLAICKRLVKLMGGEINAESIPGEGSKFWFELELEKASLPCAYTPVKESGTGVRVLVVDDNPVVAEAICGYAEAWGMRADHVADAKEAIDRMSAEADGDPFRIAVIDADMPPNDGVTLIRRIRATPPIEETPAVMLVSVAKPLQPGIASTLSHTHCIDKPVLPRKLHKSMLAQLSKESIAIAGDRVTGDAAGELSKIDTGALVLVAEDNPASRQLMIELLAVLGLRAHAVADGQAVINAMQDKRYDLILMDCQMPAMDGYEVTARLRQEHPDPMDPVIVAVSAFVSNEHSQRCLDVGMNDYIAKPLRLDGLRNILEKWIPDDEDTRVQGSALDGEVWHDWRLRNSRHPEILIRLVSMFVDDADHRLALMSTAWNTGDRIILGREAHALRSGCLQLGAARMADYCVQIEQAVQREETTTILHRLVDLEKEFGRVKRELVDIQSHQLEV